VNNCNASTIGNLMNRRDPDGLLLLPLVKSRPDVSVCGQGTSGLDMTHATRS